MQQADNQQSLNNQKYLGNKGLILFIAIMNMFIPLSIDLYLPALPKMSLYFQSSAAITNLTLSAFFILYAVGILVWGTLSDKYGRKPILMIGSIVYVISSIACALSANVYFLILARSLQGIGAGGITSVSTAMIKDCFSGKKRETMLAVTQSITGIAPMVAPIIGAWVLKLSSWRGAFYVLAAIGLVNLILTFLYSETLPANERFEGTLAGSMSRLLLITKNKSFFIPAVLFSLGSLPFMGYLALSSYIYVDFFHLSEQAYSYYFAINSFILTMGPILYVRYLRGLEKKKFAASCFSLAVLSGILVITVGKSSPIAFLVSFAIMSLMNAALRPFSVYLLFEQQKTDTGAVSSIINTLFTVLGSIGMAIASIPMGNIVARLGILIVIFYGAALIGWLAFIRSRVPCIGIKETIAD